MSIGAPGRIRTSDTLVRSQVLYPAELRAQIRLDPLCVACCSLLLKRLLYLGEFRQYVVLMNSQKIEAWLRYAAQSLRRLLNLRADMDEDATVATIRENVNFHSANAWTLVFAIFVASIGLNTNSAAVIIGAMLISPLMGPIVGAGLAMGINDFSLLKRSGQNLLYAVVISILTSTCYFLVSPLSEVQSELLARTQPTFYDVLIAIFGGAAGIVAVSRKEKGNAIPGVAIATALMPPPVYGRVWLGQWGMDIFCGSILSFRDQLRFHLPVDLCLRSLHEI